MDDPYERIGDGTNFSVSYQLSNYAYMRLVEKKKKKNDSYCSYLLATSHFILRFILFICHLWRVGRSHATILGCVEKCIDLDFELILSITPIK